MRRIAELQTHAAQMQEAIDLLQVRWLATRQEWNDAQAERLEQQYLQPLLPRIQSTLDAINRLDQFLMRLQRECEGYE